ncbi:MAG: tripartite tricarboxylate transporter substrate binding protein [Betaproteobacteria bacterium]|nr:tripartite tricarboxylate transporter substrate binding protein [Betaproteobacteria bacterium]
MKPRLVLLLLLAALGAYSGTALAQSFPSKPVRIVVPYPAGGSIDTTARLISVKMAEALAQPVLVENRAGAGARIGQDFVAKATPDGHTILIDTVSLAISPALYRNLPFDAAKDFTPVTRLVGTTLVLAVSPKVQAASVRELIALAKSKPGGLNHGHTGVGTSLHMAMELFKLSTGIDILGIPYKGDALVSNALMAGEVDVAIVTLPSSLQSVKVGRMRALGVSSARRTAVLPDVPTIDEAGVSGYEYGAWQGLYAPSKTPRGIVDMIQREAAKAINAPEVRDRLLATGLEVIGSTQEEAEARYKSDLAKFARIVREARIPLQD